MKLDIKTSFKKFDKDKGITRHFTTPRRPQNNVTKCLNRNPLIKGNVYEIARKLI